MKVGLGKIGVVNRRPTHFWFPATTPSSDQENGEVPWRKPAESLGKISLSGIRGVADVVAEPEIVKGRRLRGHFEHLRVQLRSQLPCFEILIPAHDATGAWNAPGKNVKRMSRTTPGMAILAQSPGDGL
jgi:hypothetical protein